MFLSCAKVSLKICLYLTVSATLKRTLAGKRLLQPFLTREAFAVKALSDEENSAACTDRSQ